MSMLSLRPYSAEFKAQVINSYNKHGFNATLKTFGISNKTLCAWIKKSKKVKPLSLVKEIEDNIASVRANNTEIKRNMANISINLPEIERLQAENEKLRAAIVDLMLEKIELKRAA